MRIIEGQKKSSSGTRSFSQRMGEYWATVNVRVIARMTSNINMFLKFLRRAGEPKSQTYWRLHTGDDEGKELPVSEWPITHSQSVWKSILSLYAIFLSCIFVVFLLWTYISWKTNYVAHPHPIQISPCGHTSTEALAKSCHFDIISFSWLPSQCYDSDLAEEFKGLTNWAYYLDRNKTQPISQELALTGEFAGLFTEFEYHLRHCTYLWKKMHRALLGRGKGAIDSVTGVYAHTEHCAHMLMSRREVELDVVNAIIMVKFPDCGIA